MASLRATRTGLSSAEANRRLAEFGPNRIVAARRTPLLRRLLAEFAHFFAIILWIAAALAFVAEYRDPGHGMAVLGVAIVAVILVNGLFAFLQVYRAERALASLEGLLPRRARVLRDGALAELPATALVPGDVLALTAGDLVPADCRLLQAYEVRVNDAVLTGESAPRPRRAVDPAADPMAIDRALLGDDTAVLAGVTIVAGDATALVLATGMHTAFGRIAALAQATPPASFPLQRELRFLSRVVAGLALCLGVVFFLLGLSVPLSFWQNLVFAIGIIVANVPEGLLPTVTLSLAMGAQRMARRQVLIRHLPAVETLGSATVICTDKTGTLTENRMSVARIQLDDTAEAVSPGQIPAADTPARRWFFDTLRLCHNLPLQAAGAPAATGDPMDQALLALGQRARAGAPAPERVDELPFDSDRKRISTLHRDAAGLVLHTKGALETVLPLCVTAGGAPLDAAARQRWTEREAALADAGLRVLAVAGRRVAADCPRAALEAGLTLLGLVALSDPPRAEVAGAIRSCRTAGIRVIMLTGDHPRTAVGIARQVGLASGEPLVITGDQLGRMSDSQLQLALDAPEVVFARLAADQKLRIVTILQRKGEVVAVTGDGVNDAPALRKADIGIAMGATGTDVARETADMVLLDDNFASLVAAVEEGRVVFANLRKFLTYILTSNVPELVPYLAFVLLGIPLPLTVIQILLVDLGTDMLPALALGAERPAGDEMRRPPRRRDERLVTRGLLLRAYLFLGPLQAVAALAAFWFVMEGGGWSLGQDVAPTDALWPTYLQATTACLAAIVLLQVVNVFLCRSEHHPVTATPLFANRLIWLGIAVELLLLALVVYTPQGNALFGTRPLEPAVWLFILPFAVAMLLLEEGRKWVVRRRART